MRQNTPFASVSTRLDALPLPPDAPASWALSPALTPLTPCCVAGNVVHLRLHLTCLDTLHVHVGSANNTGQVDQLGVVGRVDPFAWTNGRRHGSVMSGC